MHQLRLRTFAIRQGSYVWKLLAVYWTLFCVVLLLILHGGRGVFSYTLDDPYIHMALAQRILHGHYGLNAGEAASPSSSVLWPFLLAPLSTSAIRAFQPLLLNAIFASATSVIVGLIMDEGGFGEGFQGRLSNAVRWIYAFIFVVAANLIGLTYIGMEHMLQVLLVSGCAYGVLRAFEGQAIPTWVLIMAALAPAVRYEDLAFTLIVATILALQSRWRAALVVFLLSLVPLLVFGVFLHTLGLPSLPTSVLVKGGTTAGSTMGAAGHTGLAHAIVRTAVVNAKAYVTMRDHWSITFGFAILLGIAWVNRTRRASRNAALAAAMGSLVFMLLGPFGWFFRYEVCVRLLVLLLVVSMLRHMPFARWALLALSLWSALPYAEALRRTPRAAIDIGRQQFEMHRFEEDYKQPVMLNDLGWVSFDHDPHIHITDMFGLGSYEAAVHTKDAAYLRELAAKSNAGLAMIYTSWFPGRPPEWQRVGELRIAAAQHGGLLGGLAVDFYATRPDAIQAICDSLVRLASTVPPGVRVSVWPACTGVSKVVAARSIAAEGIH